MNCNNKKTLSLCMIVKNEEEYIDACLKSIYDLVDEVIIIDTGSTDKTKSICRKYTNNIYDFEWIDDFGAARDFSFNKATGDCIMWWDADDVLLESDRLKFKELMNTLSDDSFYSMVYDYAFDSYGHITLSLKRNRIIKNEKKPNHNYWTGFVHEILPLDINEAINSDVHITHTRNHSNGTRNLDLFENKLKQGEKFDSRNTLYYAKELYYNGQNDRAIIEFEKFLEMGATWVEDVIDVLIKMADIYNRREDIVKERECLYKTFDHAMRAEALYPLGLSFSKEKKYAQSIYFLESILKLEFPAECGGFLRNDEWNLKPLIELSCAYYYIGKVEEATKYHLKAKEISPTNSTIVYNEQFFK